MKIDKNKLRNLIGSGKTERAIKELLVVTAKVDEATHSQVTNLQSQYNKLRSEEIAGILSTDESGRRYAKINKSLLDMISLLPNGYPVKQQKLTITTPTDSPQTVHTPPTTPIANTVQPTVSIPINPNAQPLSALNYMLLFLLMLVIVIGVLTFFLTSGYGDNKTVQYFILVFLGLIVAAFTHGVMNSRSNLEGNTSKLMVRIGGPIVAFVLTVAGGYYFLNF